MPSYRATLDAVTTQLAAAGILTFCSETCRGACCQAAAQGHPCRDLGGCSAKLPCRLFFCSGLTALLAALLPTATARELTALRCEAEVAVQAALLDGGSFPCPDLFASPYRVADLKRLRLHHRLALTPRDQERLATFLAELTALLAGAPPGPLLAETAELFAGRPRPRQHPLLPGLIACLERHRPANRLTAAPGRPPAPN